VVATELFPSETIDLDREHLAAIVTEQGGENSHAAILARSLGVPAVTGVSGATDKIRTGMEVLVDAEKGEVRIGAGPTERLKFHDERREHEEFAPESAPESAAGHTRSDDAIRVMANIGRPEDIVFVERYALEGVGLFRTEYLFLRSARAPQLDDHRGAYQRVADSLGDRHLVIRTLDLGGDKLPAFLVRDHERNPSLEARGLRFSLEERRMFELQIRAILEVQTATTPDILLPMVFGPDDLKRGIAFIENVATGLGCSSLPRIGAMIETPAALFTLHEILDAADFISLGTNDLIQFMLAADRGSLASADSYTVLHPSVVRAISHVVTACTERNRPVSLCGEIAGDPFVVPLLIGLGVRVLSMSPVRAPKVRSVLRRVDLQQAEELASETLAARSAASIVELVRRFVESLAPTDGSGRDGSKSRLH
jgi:phosphoenolpyruvate-protein phosphotransferase